MAAVGQLGDACSHEPQQLRLSGAAGAGAVCYDMAGGGVRLGRRLAATAAVPEATGDPTSLIAHYGAPA